MSSPTPIPQVLAAALCVVAYRFYVRRIEKRSVLELSRVGAWRELAQGVLRVGELLAKRKSADEIKRDVDAGFNEGRYVSPHKAGIAYMLLGDVQIDPKTQVISSTSFPPHYMIYAPGVSNADIGISRAALKDRFDLPFVYAGYSGGTRMGYIIVLAKQAKDRTP